MMKLFTNSTIALFTLTSVVGCSSADKGGVAAASSEALASIQNPTGTFDRSNGSQAFAAYTQNKQSSSNVAATGGGSPAGGTTAQSIKFLANQTGRCAPNQACACPGGGTMTAAVVERSSDRVEVSADMNACVFESGDAFDGKAIIVKSQKPLIDDSKLPSKAVSSGDTTALLMAMDGDLTLSGEKQHVKLVLLKQHGWVYASVDVPSGSLVIGFGPDGTSIVKAKDKTWTCESSSNGYSCKSEGGTSDDWVEVASSDSTPASTGSAAANDSAGADQFANGQ